VDDDHHALWEVDRKTALFHSVHVALLPSAVERKQEPAPLLVAVVGEVGLRPARVGCCVGRWPSRRWACWKPRACKRKKKKKKKKKRKEKKKRKRRKKEKEKEKEKRKRRKKEAVNK
jgi:hypothetical protein